MFIGAATTKEKASHPVMHPTPEKSTLYCSLSRPYFPARRLLVFHLRLPEGMAPNNFLFAEVL